MSDSQVCRIEPLDLYNGTTWGFAMIGVSNEHVAAPSRPKPCGCGQKRFARWNYRHLSGEPCRSAAVSLKHDGLESAIERPRFRQNVVAAWVDACDVADQEDQSS